MSWTIEQYRQHLSKGLEKKDTPARRAKVSPRKSALKSCDRDFSLLMRAKEANYAGLVKCCTCPKLMPWKGTGEAHWGHWQSRGFNSTRWNPINGGVQCRECNTYLEGRKADMERYLIGRYGEADVRKVEAFSRLSVKYSEFELNQMALQFREELKQIVKDKNLTP